MLTRAAHAVQRGFSAVELMVVVAIIAVGASLAAPGAATLMANRRVQAASESIVDGLQQARAEAVRRNTPVRFTLQPTGWTLANAGSGDVLHAYSSPDWRALMMSNAGGPSVTFLPTGLRQGGAQLSQVTVVSAVDQARSRRINVFGGGLIRMCDPAIATAGDPRRC